MRISMLFLFLVTFRAARATCPCDGITLEGTDQNHCWQIQSRTDMSYDSADDVCVAVGGHLGHPTESNYADIVKYVQNSSSLPVLTGIVAGNTEIPVIGQMCQNNAFHGVANGTIYENEPTTSKTCAYIKRSANKLVFDSCTIDAQVLCDRPLEKEDYCSIMANCSSTTSTFFSTTTGMSSTTASILLTSSTTQSYSSSVAGETSPSTTTTTKIGQSSTTTISGGQGGSGSSSSSGSSSGSVSVSSPTASATTCKCPSADVATTTTTVTACAEQTGCLKHQWKIFGMCIDWRAMLALLLIGLLLFLCCCICHCCMHACMFCTPGKKDKDRSVIAPVPLPLPKKMDYDVEKSAAIVLPPPAIQPEPVYITVPEKHESVYGFHTKEIIHVMPERPSTREVGTMTDSMKSELPTIMPVPVQAPMMKRKKAVKKPKKMFIPAAADPMNSIEEDVAAEIPIEMPESPGARSVAPLGDAMDPAPMVPLNFSRNPKPMMPEPKPHDDIPVPARNGQSSFAPPVQHQKPNIPPSDNEEFDPSGLRSPPIPPAGNPKRMTFSPIADESEEETGARIPSPPREPKASGGRPGNNGGSSSLGPNAAAESRPTLKNQRLNEMPSPTPAANAPAPSKSPVSGAGGSNNPFANLGGTSPAPAADGAGRGPGDDVGMRAARGRLGGAVRGGGGGGEAPSGWKPWAKGGARR